MILQTDPMEQKRTQQVRKSTDTKDTAGSEGNEAQDTAPSAESDPADYLQTDCRGNVLPLIQREFTTELP